MLVKTCKDKNNFYKMMNKSFSGHTHSMDTGIACLHGVPAALLYNHFCYWIKHNLLKGDNFIDGKTWTYQTIEEMRKYLPYLSIKQIRNAVDALVEGNLIVKAQHNKSDMDRKMWYALADDNSGENLSQNIFENEEKQKNETQVVEYERLAPQGNSMCPPGQMDLPPRAIHIYNVEYKETKERKEESALSLGLFNFFFSILKEINPKIQKPNEEKWIKQFDLLMTQDMRTEQEIRQIIEFLLQDHQKPSANGFTWSKAVQSPEKLRKHFAAMWLQMTQVNPKQEKEKQSEKKFDISKKNKFWIQDLYEKTLKKLPGIGLYFSICDNCVWIKIPGNGQSAIGFSENGFKQQIENHLRKVERWPL